MVFESLLATAIALCGEGAKARDYTSVVDSLKRAEWQEVLQSRETLDYLLLTRADVQQCTLVFVCLLYVTLANTWCTY